MTREHGARRTQHTPPEARNKDQAKQPTSSPYLHTSSFHTYTPNTPQVNRNKKSLALSFQHPSGVAILHKLAETCDVLVENYLPGSLKKYNMDYASIAAINPKLIYASITGYGQTGPYSNRPGYDVMVEACGPLNLTNLHAP